MTEALKLSEDELAFLRFTCGLFFLPESPLWFVEGEKREPKSFAQAHDLLVRKGLVDADTWRGKDEQLVPVQIVAECDGRVLWQRYADGNKEQRDFYVATGKLVEFGRDSHGFSFGGIKREQDLVDELVARFRATPAGGQLLDLVMTPGEYLVFAVFARDVREKKEAASDHMTVAEVLACFEDEVSVAHVPRDSDFEKHTNTLSTRGLLFRDGAGNFALAKHLHAFARGLSSETYDALTRYDFIDDEWLIREATVYPADHAVYLLSSLADGSVSIRELDSEQLFEVIAQAVATLPDVSDNPNQVRSARDFFIRA